MESTIQINGFNPTQEQLIAVDTAIKSKRIKINAFAGCSKTTTLKLISDALPEKSLYVAFNKAIATEARAKFSMYVECRTTHSMAYQALGLSIAHKLKRPSGGYQNCCGTGKEIAQYFGIKSIKSGDLAISAPLIGACVKRTVARFEQSACFELGADHVSMSLLEQIEAAHKGEFAVVKQTVFGRILDAARSLWRLRIDPSVVVMATHDTYLKLWQLSNPDLSQYKTIYLDEAADTSPCVLDVLMRQGGSRLVFVGDRHQNIYGFRGAVNAMADDGSGAWDMLTLSTSFRFGANIARVANAILGIGEIKGFLPSDTVVRAWAQPDGFHAMIYRTNIKLLIDAVRMIEGGQSVAINVDSKDMAELITSLDALNSGQMSMVKHVEVLPYKDWDELVSDDDGPLRSIVKIVSKGEHYRMLGVLQNHKNPARPDVMMTTAHKSKGLEWDTVVLADDFPSVYDEHGKYVGLVAAERNLLYVAATRAKKALHLNSTAIDIIDRKNGAGRV